MILKRLILTASITAILAACASKDVVDVVEEPIDVAKTNTTSKDETVTWNNKARRGAAYSEPGYRHVLADRNVGSLQDTPPEPSISANPAEVIQRATSIKSYSVYEMGRWERFCGHGAMDSKDWDFIAREGRDNIPETLRADCSAPAYTRQDYIAAWKSKCDGAEASTQDLVIRNTTIAPPRICNE